MGQKSSAKSLSSFVANAKELQAVCDEISGNIQARIPQPVLIIGQEGAGKTTLLKRLPTKYVEACTGWIDGRFIFDTKDIIDYATGKRIIIIDNLDYYFARCDYDEQFRLRRFLYQEGAPMLIGSVSRLIPAITEYKAPFFEGLKKIYLPPITSGEISYIFEGESHKRATSMLYLISPTIKSVEIIAHIIDHNSKMDDDLKLLISYYSSTYKLIYSNIPTNSQRILNILGGAETGMTVPEMRSASGLAAGTLTSYLKSLRIQGLVTIDRTVARHSRYAVKDPLFKIWLKSETLS